MIIRLGTIMLATLVLGSLAIADDRQEITRLLETSKITLVEAIDKAAEQVPGGVLMDIELEEDDDTAVFEVEFFVEEGIKQVKIDAASGEVRKMRDVELPENLRDETIANCHAVADASAGTELNHAAAITAAADAAGGGKPYEVKMKVRGERLVYDVRMLGEGKLVEALIAADDHEVLRVQDRGKR